MAVKNIHFTLRQKNAQWCAIYPKTNTAVKVIYDILSYQEIMNLRGFPEKITRSILNKQGYPKFPCGLISYVTQRLIKLGHTVDVKYLKDTHITRSLLPKLKGNIYLEDYQKKILRKIHTKQRGLICAPTGAGKTIVIGSLIALYKMPTTLVIVPTTDTFKNAYETLSYMFPQEKIGVIGNGVKSIEPITVAIWKSLSKWNLKEYNKLLQMVIVDEAHEVNKTSQNVMKQLTNVHYRFALTATPQEPHLNFKKWLIQEGTYGSTLVTITDKEAASRVTGVDVWMITHEDHNPQGVDYHDIYRKDVLLNKKRNTALIKMAYRAIEKNRRVMILIDEISQGEALYDLALRYGVNLSLLHGKCSQKYIDKEKANLINGKIGGLIATNIFGRGTNIPVVDTVILGSVRKSIFQIIQRIGRGRRKTKSKGEDNLVVIDVFDIINTGKKDYFGRYSRYRKDLYTKRGWFKGFIDEV